MEKRDLKCGDVVQISPDCQERAFAGCFLTVTEPKAFGCQGFVHLVGTRGKAGWFAYFRLTWEEMEYVGSAAWAPRHHAEAAEVARKEV